MTASLDSTRPIMPQSPCDNVHYNTFENPPKTQAQNDEKAHEEISNIAQCLARMKNQRLDAQRVKLTGKQVTLLGIATFKTPLIRALDQRMSNQDAVMRPRENSTSKPKHIPIIVDKKLRNN